MARSINVATDSEYFNLKNLKVGIFAIILGFLVEAVLVYLGPISNERSTFSPSTEDVYTHIFVYSAVFGIASLYLLVNFLERVAKVLKKHGLITFEGKSDVVFLLFFGSFIFPYFDKKTSDLMRMNNGESVKIISDGHKKKQWKIQVLLNLIVFGALFYVLNSTFGFNKVHVPEDTSLVVVRFGQVLDVIDGPNETEVIRAIDLLKYIPDENEIVLEGGLFKVNYTVKNPEAYYLFCGNSRLCLSEIIEKELASLSLNSNDLTRFDVKRAINSLNLPIKATKILSSKGRSVRFEPRLSKH